MVFLFKNTNGPITWGAVSNMIPTPITGLTATSTVAGQIVLTWSGGIGQNVKYTYALSIGTVQSIGALSGNGVGTPYSVTLTLTSTNSITTIVTLTATVLGGSTSAVSNSVTTIAPIPTPDLIQYKYNNTTVSGTSFINAASGSVGNGSIWTANGTATTSSSKHTTIGTYSVSIASTNGSKNVVSTPLFTPPSTAGQGYTICAFINYVSTGNTMPFQMSPSYGTNDTNNAFQNSSNGTVYLWGFSPLYFALNGSVNNQVQATSTTNTWYHIAFTNLCNTTGGGTGAAGSGIMYFNGSQFNTTTEYWGGNNSSLGLSESSFNGNIYDFRLYGSVLTPAQIATIYNATK